MKHSSSKFRLTLVSWALLPGVVVWLVTSYLVGSFYKTAWSSNTSATPAVASESPRTFGNESLFKWSGGGLVTLWFDDAWSTQYTVAYPLLKERGMVGVLSVPTSYMGDSAYTTWSQVRDVWYNGWELAAHSRVHDCDITTLTDQLVESEVQGSLSDLRSQGFEPTNYVTPCGIYDNRTTALVKKNFASLRTAGDGLNPLPVTNRYDLLNQTIEITTTVDQVKNWLQQAKSERSWLILTFHQVDKSGLKYSVPPQRMVEILDAVKASGLPVVLSRQVLEINSPASSAPAVNKNAPGINFNSGS